MEKIMEFLEDSVGLLLILLVISLAVVAGNTMKRTGVFIEKDLISPGQVLVQNKFNMYKDSTVKGTDVINAINCIDNLNGNSKYKVDVDNGLILKTYSKYSEYTAKQESDSGFIYANDKYSSKMEYNTNGSIKKITFIKK